MRAEPEGIIAAGTHAGQLRPPEWMGHNKPPGFDRFKPAP